MHRSDVPRLDGQLHFRGLFDDPVDPENRRRLPRRQFLVLQKNPQRLGSLIEQQHQAFFAFLKDKQIRVF